MHRVNTMIDIQEAFISEFHTTLYKSYWKQQFTQTEKYLSFWLMQQTLNHCDIWSFLDGIPNLILHYCCRTSTLINMKISRDHYTYSEYETQTLPHSLGIFLCSVMLFFLPALPTLWRMLRVPNCWSFLSHFLVVYGFQLYS